MSSTQYVAKVQGYHLDLRFVEWKYNQPEAPIKEHNSKGKTLRLCLPLTKYIHGTGSLVVMDSGFCVLQALVDLRNVGVFR